MRGGRVPRSLKGECIAGARAAQALHEDSAHSRAHLLEGGLNPLAAGTRGGRQPDPQGGDGERPAGALRWAPSRRRAALPGAPHQGAAPRGAGRGAGSQSLAAPGPVVAPRSLLESRVRRGHRICTSNFPRLLCCPLETKQGSSSASHPHPHPFPLTPGERRGTGAGVRVSRRGDASLQMDCRTLSSYTPLRMCYFGVLGGALHPYFSELLSACSVAGVFDSGDGFGTNLTSFKILFPTSAFFLQNPKSRKTRR